MNFRARIEAPSLVKFRVVLICYSTNSPKNSKFIKFGFISLSFTCMRPHIYTHEIQSNQMAREGGSDRESPTKSGSNTVLNNQLQNITILICNKVKFWKPTDKERLSYFPVTFPFRFQLCICFLPPEIKDMSSYMCRGTQSIFSSFTKFFCFSFHSCREQKENFDNSSD